MNRDERIRRTRERLERLRTEPRPVRRRCKCGVEHLLSTDQAEAWPPGSLFDCCLDCFHMMVAVEGERSVLAAADREHRVEEMLASRAGWKCPHCGGALEPELAPCPACGRYPRRC